MVTNALFQILGDRCWRWYRSEVRDFVFVLRVVRDQPAYSALRAFHLLDIGEQYENVAETRPAGAEFFRFLKWDDNRELARVSRGFLL
jgi:hypothetical protein